LLKRADRREGEVMPKFTQAAGQTVASDVRSAFDSLDRAVHDAARLATDFIEACVGSELPPARSQRVLKSLADGITKFVDARADMVQAQRTLVSIKTGSNLDVFDFGCWMNDAQKPPVAAMPCIEAAPAPVLEQ
jgi:hypothetical protein